MVTNIELTLSKILRALEENTKKLDRISKKQEELEGKIGNIKITIDKSWSRVEMEARAYFERTSAEIIGSKLDKELKQFILYYSDVLREYQSSCEDFERLVKIGLPMEIATNIIKIINEEQRK